MAKLQKRIGQWARICIFSLMLLGGLYFLMAALLAIIPYNRNYVPSDSGIEVFVQSQGIHTDLIIPVDSLLVLNLGDQRWADYSYLAFGWGDKDFYTGTPTWDDVNIYVTLKAVFWPSTSVMQVKGLRKKPETGKYTVKTRVNQEQFQLLRSYILNSFDRKENSFALVSAPGYDLKNMAFYTAKGHYSALKTCNQWVSLGLQTAGVKSSIWTPFPAGVRYQIGNE